AAGPDDAVIEPQFSTDLTTWSLPVGWDGVESEATITPVAGGKEQVHYGPLTYPPLPSRDFFRLNVRAR
ncbi:MAG TPA: hypothetical protein VG796_08995, partial [Verrucomicrobiales bacterium]|nr:hypothetical protein [Verrucomicrobiales bacterium]